VEPPVAIDSQSIATVQRPIYVGPDSIVVLAYQAGDDINASLCVDAADAGILRDVNVVLRVDRQAVDRTKTDTGSQLSGNIRIAERAGGTCDRLNCAFRRNAPEAIVPAVGDQEIALRWLLW
jgi:hypothetical protein